MKSFIYICTIGLFVLSGSGFANQTASSSEEHPTNAQTTLSQEVKSLKQEVYSLQYELRALKEKKAAPPVRIIPVKSNSAKKKEKEHTLLQHPHQHTLLPHPPAHMLVSGKKHPTTGEKYYKLSKLDIGVPVYIAPYVEGINPRYDVSALIVNVTNVNRDKGLLDRRRRIVEVLHFKHFIVPDFPTLALSGELRGRATVLKPYSGKWQSDIDFVDTKIDGLIQANPWAIGFFTWAYDNDPNNVGARISNSRLFLETGFITFGNFEAEPFYATVGQVFVSYGRFYSYMISAPLTALIGETVSRAITVGYKYPGNDGPYATIYFARSETKPKGQENRINLWGIDAGYLIDYEGWLQSEIGASYINNLADARGIQRNNSKAPFKGFDRSSASQKIIRRVPGYDVYLKFAFSDYVFFAEYTGAATCFSPQNLTYNGDGAEPKAYHIEGVYHFKMWNKLSSIALSFGQSFQALAYNIPKYRIMTTLSSELLRSVVFSLEYRFDVNYERGDTATGQGLPAFIADELGRSSHTVTANATMYF